MILSLVGTSPFWGVMPFSEPAFPCHPFPPACACRSAHVGTGIRLLCYVFACLLMMPIKYRSFTWGSRPSCICHVPNQRQTHPFLNTFDIS